MPTSAPVTPDKVRALQAQYGSGPFGQLMMNLALAPTPQALIDLTGGPETWAKAIKNPIELDPQTSFFHGLTSLLDRRMGDFGLKRGWFAKEPAEWFGPNFAEAKFGDLPQPVIAAQRGTGMAKYDPLFEYSPAWAGKDVAKRELDRLQSDVSSGYMRIHPQELRSSIKSAQHEIAKPSPDISIPLDKLTYVNPITGERGPFREVFQRLMDKGASKMSPEEFKAFVENLKKPF
jgi:hypothetical protein